MLRQFRLDDEGDGDGQQETYFACEDPPAAQENCVENDESGEGTEAAGESALVPVGEVGGDHVLIVGSFQSQFQSPIAELF